MEFQESALRRVKIEVELRDIQWKIGVDKNEWIVLFPLENLDFYLKKSEKSRIHRDILETFTV